MEEIAIIGGGAAGLAAAIRAAQTLRAHKVAVGNLACAHNVATGDLPCAHTAATGDLACAHTAATGDLPCAHTAATSDLPFVHNAAAGDFSLDDSACYTAAVRVVVYEADERVGRSILATGNGRCNFSNAHIDAALYRNEAFVKQTFSVLELKSRCLGNPVHEFFSQLGLMWFEESQGRLYPLANRATGVVDVLRAGAAKVGVHEACCCKAVRIDVPQRAGERFHIRLSDKTIHHAAAVIVAVGGRAFEALEISCLPTYAHPHFVLGPLRTDTAWVKSLNNIRVRCEVSLVDAHGKQKLKERGEVLFRTYGVSGIVIFNMSRAACVGDTLLIDMLPYIPICDMEQFLFDRGRLLAKDDEMPTLQTLLRGMVLARVAQVVLDVAGLDPLAQLDAHNVKALVRALKCLPVRVGGIADARQCQVVRGGCALCDIDAHTMQVHGVAGLYVVGEALDVDGPCGGYNLHWAWASGMVAGDAAATHFMDRYLRESKDGVSKREVSKRGVSEREVSEV